MTNEKREILKKLEVGTTYSGVDVICRQYKEIERLNNDIKELLKENSNKEKVIIAQDNIINKAIEYMERYMFSQKENYDYIHLLDILKGSDKE